MPELPKIADAPLSVVLLARKSDAEIDAVVQSWIDWLGQRPADHEILVVLADGQAANPGAEIDDPRVRLIHQVAPLGAGAGLQSAVAMARFPLLLTSSADRQFQPADAARLFAQIDQVHLVCGCRVAAPPPWWLRTLGLAKRMLTRILMGYADEPRASWLGWDGLGRRWRVRLIFGVKLHDAECVFRLYRTDVLQRFPIQARGSFAHLEVLAKANHLGCWMAETPVPWQPAGQQEHEPSWTTDAKTVRRRPEFAWAAGNCGLLQ